MTNVDYQIQKEHEVKRLNRVAQLINANSFPKKTKALLVDQINIAANAIIDNRKIVYKDLFDSDYDITFDPNSPNAESVLSKSEKNIQDVKYISHEINEVIITILYGAEQNVVRYVIDEMTFKKFVPTDEFRANQATIKKALQSIIDNLNPQDEEALPTTTDTQEALPTATTEQPVENTTEEKKIEQPETTTDPVATTEKVDTVVETTPTEPTVETKYDVLVDEPKVETTEALSENEPTKVD